MLIGLIMAIQATAFPCCSNVAQRKSAHHMHRALVLCQKVNDSRPGVLLNQEPVEVLCGPPSLLMKGKKEVGMLSRSGLPARIDSLVSRH